MKLKRAGFFKDGGSIGAEFEKDDGTPFNVFLEISPEFWSKKNKKIHRKLFSCGPNEIDRAQPIVKNSQEEAVILKALDDWVRSNVSHEEQQRIGSGEMIPRDDDHDVFCILKLIPAIKQREPGD